MRFGVYTARLGITSLSSIECVLYVSVRLLTTYVPYDHAFFFSFDNTGVTKFHPFSRPKLSKTQHKMALFLSWLGWVVLARQLNRPAADKGLEENVDDFVKVNV